MAFRRLVAASGDLHRSLRPDPRRPASAQRPAERPSLCGPATATCLAFAVRRTDFSLGEGLDCKFRLVTPVRNTVSQFRAPGKLPQVHRGWESSLSRMGLTGRCPVTIKLMSQMIGMILENGESTIKLLHQNYTRQLVGQRHLSQR